MIYLVKHLGYFNETENYLRNYLHETGNPAPCICLQKIASALWLAGCGCNLKSLLTFPAFQTACLTRLCKYYPGGAMGSRDAKSRSTITISGAPVCQEWKNTSLSAMPVVRIYPPRTAPRPCLFGSWWAWEQKAFSCNKPNDVTLETVLSSQIFQSTFF